jgi:hypothetical protein
MLSSSNTVLKLTRILNAVLSAKMSQARDENHAPTAHKMTGKSYKALTSLWLGFGRLPSDPHALSSAGGTEGYSPGQCQLLLEHMPCAFTVTIEKIKGSGGESRK